jgi:hypothetical protein
MPRRIVVAAALAFSLNTGVAQSDATPQAELLPPPRITALDARYAAHSVFDVVAQALDHKPVITPCRPIGSLSRTCRVRIGHARYRIIARYVDANEMVWVSAQQL